MEISLSDSLKSSEFANPGGILETCYTSVKLKPLALAKDVEAVVARYGLDNFVPGESVMRDIADDQVMGFSSRYDYNNPLNEESECEDTPALPRLLSKPATLATLAQAGMLDYHQARLKQWGLIPDETDLYQHLYERKKTKEQAAEQALLTPIYTAPLNSLTGDSIKLLGQDVSASVIWPGMEKPHAQYKEIHPKHMVGQIVAGIAVYEAVRKSLAPEIAVAQRAVTPPDMSAEQRKEADRILKLLTRIVANPENHPAARSFIAAMDGPGSQDEVPEALDGVITRRAASAKPAAPAA